MPNPFGSNIGDPEEIRRRMLLYHGYVPPTPLQSFAPPDAANAVAGEPLQEAISSLRPEPVPAAKSSKSLAVAKILGETGAAVMGRHQDSWQAQLGKQTAARAQDTIFSRAMSRAVGGARIGAEELHGLSADQSAAIQKATKDAGVQRFDRVERVVKLLQGADKLNLDAKQVGILRDQLFAEIESGKETRALKRDELAQDLEIAKMGAAGRERVAEIGAQADQARTQVLRDQLLFQTGNDPIMAQAITDADAEMKSSGLPELSPEELAAAHANAIQRAYIRRGGSKFVDWDKVAPAADPPGRFVPNPKTGKLEYIRSEVETPQIGAMPVAGSAISPGYRTEAQENLIQTIKGGPIRKRNLQDWITR